MTLIKDNSKLDWRELLILIFGVILAFLFLVVLAHLHYYYLVWQIGLTKAKSTTEYGSSFGAFSAIISGLALIGVIVSIYLQREDLKSYKKEVEVNQDNQSRTLEGLQKQIEIMQMSAEVNILKYFIEIFVDKEDAKNKAAKSIISKLGDSIINSSENINYLLPRIDVEIIKIDNDIYGIELKNVGEKLIDLGFRFPEGRNLMIFGGNSRELEKNRTLILPLNDAIEELEFIVSYRSELYKTLRAQNVRVNIDDGKYRTKIDPPITFNRPQKEEE